MFGSNEIFKAQPFNDYAHHKCFFWFSSMMKAEIVVNLLWLLNKSHSSVHCRGTMLTAGPVFHFRRSRQRDSEALWAIKHKDILFLWFVLYCYWNVEYKLVSHWCVNISCSTLDACLYTHHQPFCCCAAAAWVKGIDGCDVLILNSSIFFFSTTGILGNVSDWWEHKVTIKLQ